MIHTFFSNHHHHHPVKCNHLPNIMFLFFTPNPVTFFITPSKLINSTTNRLVHHQALPTYEQVSITRNLNSKNCLLTTSSTVPKFPANLLFFVKLYYHPKQCLILHHMTVFLLKREKIQKKIIIFL